MVNSNLKHLFNKSSNLADYIQSIQIRRIRRDYNKQEMGLEPTTARLEI